MKFLSICLSLFFIIQFCTLSAQNNSGEINKIKQSLNNKEKAIISIASLTTKGDLENLKGAITQGLETGLTVNEIKEVMVHLYAYCGFPRSLQGLRTFIVVLEERKAKGITDTLGEEATTILDNRSKYDRGKEILETLVKRPLDGPKADYAEFSPIIEVFLKEHLFADIFERDVLNYKQRELVTVSVLITLGDLEPMLRGHMNICLLQGISPSQLQELIQELEKNIDTKKTASARHVLDELLKANNLPNTTSVENKINTISALKIIFRISEIEVHPKHIEAYSAILKNEAEASVKLEAGVICIFPMFQKESPNQFRVLEIYANNEAYQAHLQTPHFKHYKESTLKMVKSLKLVDMNVLDEETINVIFKKIKE